MAYSLGMVGAGRWAARYCDTLRESFPEVRVSQIARRGQTRPDFISDSTIVVQDWRDMVERGDFDGLIVCADPSIHVDVAYAALSKGIPVMVEKPLAFSLADASRLSHLQGRAPILVNHVHLFAPAFRLLMDILRSRVRSLSTEGSNSGPYRTYSSLYDYGPHDVAMCLEIMGTDPVNVSCVKSGFGGGELFDIHMDFGSVSSTSRVGNGAGFKTRVVRMLDGIHWITYDDTAPNKLTVDETSMQVEPDPPLKCALEAFIGALSGRKDRRLGLGMALRVASVLDSCSDRLSK